MNERLGKKMLRTALEGTVDALARAGARFVESLASDVKKTLKNNAAKVAKVEDGVRTWRETTVGEIPDELKDEPEARH